MFTKFEYHKPLILILNIHILLETIYCQKITLHDFSHDLSNSTCINGLLTDIDKFVFKSHVEYTDEPFRLVYYQIKVQKENTFKHLCSIKTDDQCNDANTPHCKCKRISNNTLEILINITAHEIYKDALIRGIGIKTNDEMIISEIQKMPITYKSSDILQHLLIINGRNVSHFGNIFDDLENGPTLSIIFSCQSPASPCLIEISANDSIGAKRAKNMATFYRAYSTPQHLNISIKFAACRLDGAFQEIKGKINLNYNPYDAYSSDDLKYFALAMTVIFVLFLNLVCIITGRHTFLTVLKRKTDIETKTSKTKERESLQSGVNFELLSSHSTIDTDIDEKKVVFTKIVDLINTLKTDAISELAIHDLTSFYDDAPHIHDKREDEKVETNFLLKISSIMPSGFRSVNFRPSQ